MINYRLTNIFYDNTFISLTPRYDHETCKSYLNLHYDDLDLLGEFFCYLVDNKLIDGYYLFPINEYRCHKTTISFINFRHEFSTKLSNIIILLSKNSIYEGI
jgi:hypothetical protein